MVEYKKWEIQATAGGPQMEAIMDIISGMSPQEKALAAAVIFEEVYMNVSTHAYGEGSSEENTKPSLTEKLQKPCVVEFAVSDDGDMCLCVTDKGMAFDPTKYKLEDFSEEKVGGHGIQMIRELSKKITYSRTDQGENILEVDI